MKTYEGLITEAVKRLQAMQRKGLNPNVWAVATTPERDGYFHIGEEPPADFATIMRANQSSNWGAVPYAAQWQALYDAARREPILPLDRKAGRA